MTPRWFAQRMPGERTNVYLGRVLDLMGLRDMAHRARLGHFDDYFCPPEVDDGLNITRLIGELREHIGTAAEEGRRRELQGVIDAAMEGEFDGTEAEAKEWARSPEGRATFTRLTGRPG